MTTTATAPEATLDTVETVPSFVQDSWWTPDAGSAASAVPVRDASTGEILAKVSTDGLDLAAVVDYGRTTGQTELGKLTFHQRALKLKELAQYLNARREHFYAFSAQTGATKIDSMIDIDGGIGVLFTFGSKGRRELPNAQVVVDGPMEVLSKDGSFAGEHIYTRIPGVAVQINAFNFPVWGMLEKFAPAFIAGVPTIVKPATPTGYVAAAVVKAIIESNILPKGSLQLISGSVRGLLDVLDYRDLVAFTGSASTAQSLKSHPNVVLGGVRFTSETDSLNAAILGPDAVEGTPEFDAFIKSVVTEMTVKAGPEVHRDPPRHRAAGAGARRRSPPSARAWSSAWCSAIPAPRASPWARSPPWSSSPTSAPPCSPCSTPAVSLRTEPSIRRRSPARTAPRASSRAAPSCRPWCSAGLTPRPSRSTRWRRSARCRR